jgi:hypothetical protein
MAGRGVIGIAYFSLQNNGCTLRNAPSNKIGCRDETRHHQEPLGHHGLINEQYVFPLPTIVDHWTKNQDGFSIQNVEKAEGGGGG